MKKIIIFLLSMSAFIAQATGQTKWSSSDKIEQIISEGSKNEGRVYLLLKNGNYDKSCTDRYASNHYRIISNNERGKNQISIAMMAFSMEKSVSLITNGCDNWNRPIIIGLRIIK